MAKKAFVRKDRFYQMAKKEGYPARSAYKIIELDKKYHIFKKNAVIIDLGCAPGGWFMAGQDIMQANGKIIGVDLLPLTMAPLPNNAYLQADFTLPETKDWIIAQCPDLAHWVISDRSPNISGIKFADNLASFELCHQAFELAKQILKINGGFICKVFPGKELEEFRKELKSHFKKLVSFIPEATRQSSRECYLVCIERK